MINHSPPERRTSRFKTKRIRSVIDVRSSNVDKVTDDDEAPVRLCNYTDVYYSDRIDGTHDYMRATATTKEIDRFGLRTGDVVITKDSESWDDIAVPAEVTWTAPDFVCGYHLAILRPLAESFHGSFLRYAILSDAVRDQFRVGANGITRFGLSVKAIKDVEVPSPPVEQQRRIAGFLDRETGKIDRLVAKKRRLIALLEEKRTALITRAVTRGLDPDAPTKPSGIDWLGDVPQHWDMVRLRRLVEFITSGSRGWAEHYSQEGSLFIRIGNLTRDSIELDLSDIQRVNPPASSEGTRTRIERGDLLASITAFIGSVAVVRNLSESAYVSQHVALMRVREQTAVPVYLAYALLSAVGQRQLLEQTYGGTKVQLALTDVTSIVLPLPGKDEQKLVADWLDEEVRAFDHMRTKLQSTVDRLTEYRSALITAAVTGQIDVTADAPDPEEVADAG